MFFKLLRFKIPFNVKLYILQFSKLVFIFPEFIKFINFKNNNSIFFFANNKEFIFFFKIKSCQYKRSFFKHLKNNLIKTFKTSSVFEKIVLKLVGVGFKAITIKKNKQIILCLKLGYSHLYFLNIPEGIKVKIIKQVLYLWCNNKQKLEIFCNFVKNLKKPDSYKGKGFFFEYEKLSLKKGKKV